MLHEESQLVYWTRTARNAAVILAKMESDFGLSTFSYLWVTTWLRALRRCKDVSELTERSGKPEDLLTGVKVVSIFNLNLFVCQRVPDC
jgi:hypothetical protein